MKWIVEINKQILYVVEIDSQNEALSIVLRNFAEKYHSMKARDISIIGMVDHEILRVQ